MNEEDKNNTDNWKINLSSLIYEYLKICEQKKEYPHKAGFRKWSRISGHDFIRNKIQFDIIKEAINDLEDESLDYLIQNGLKNKLNPLITKLVLASNHGMRDKSDITSGGDKLQTLLVEFINKKDEKDTNTNGV